MAATTAVGANTEDRRGAAEGTEEEEIKLPVVTDQPHEVTHPPRSITVAVSLIENF